MRERRWIAPLHPAGLVSVFDVDPARPEESGDLRFGVNFRADANPFEECFGRFEIAGFAGEDGRKKLAEDACLRW